MPARAPICHTYVPYPYPCMQDNLGKAFDSAAKDLGNIATTATHAVINPMVSLPHCVLLFPGMQE